MSESIDVVDTLFAEEFGRRMANRVNELIASCVPPPGTKLLEPQIETIREYPDGAKLTINRAYPPRLAVYTLRVTAPAGTSLDRLDELLADMETAKDEILRESK